MTDIEKEYSDKNNLDKRDKRALLLERFSWSVRQEQYLPEYFALSYALRLLCDEDLLLNKPNTGKLSWE